MVQGSLKLCLEKPQGCRQHGVSGHFAPFCTVSIGKMIALSLQCKLVLFQVRPTLLILPSCTAVENLAPSLHASCRPAAKICSGSSPGHLSAEKPPPYYSDSLHACTICRAWSFAACLSPGPPPRSCFGTSDSENEGAGLFLNQTRLQGQLIPDSVTRGAEQVSISQEAL